MLVGGLGIAAGAVTGATPIVAAPNSFAFRATDLLFFYGTIGLMRPRNEGPPGPGWVRKWAAPAEVVLRGRVKPEFGATIDIILHRLSVLTGQEFRRVRGFDPTAKRQQIVVDFLPRDEMARRYPGRWRVYGFTRTWGHRGKIHAGRIEVDETALDCLHHEFMHAIGFDNHWPGAVGNVQAHSALARRDTAHRVNGFSPWDEHAIRVHYDNRIWPGTRRDDALSVAHNVIGEFSAA